jgi:acyl transferase domain-containing protein/phosphopantetheinyl transferase
MSHDPPIAIIGMACMFPEAPDLQSFWHNILAKVDAISEPTESWDAKRYLDSGRIKTSAGGYLKDLFRFEPGEFGIMPNSLDGGEPDQFLALRIARDALLDAGYLDKSHDHRDTGVILGHSTYLHRGQGTLIQNHIVVDQTLDVLGELCPDLGEAKLAEIRHLLSSGLPSSTADIAPALVPNVMTGRIANRLDLRGPNYLIDAACSSSLLAVAAACDELRTGRSRMMLAGGVNASLPAEVSVIFTQLGALSGRGRVRPFSTGSDGTLLGEGLGVVVLKRLDDAVQDGDRVYAVVRGIGQASDGRGLGLLAPNLEGETLAIQRAYEQTGIDPTTIGLIEAHGTGIPLGDKTEVAAIKRVFGERGAGQGSLALGSVKSMISHCIPAAGIAGLIKATLSVHHKLLPPTLCEEINPELGLEAPLFVNTEVMPWIQAPGAPRRAGINSFGFGGINAHAIVEEAPSAAVTKSALSPWPSELCVFSASDVPALLALLDQTEARLAQHPEWTLSEIARALSERDGGQAHRLAMVVSDRAALGAALQGARKKLSGPIKERFATRTGLFYSSRPLGGPLAFVFPGEGSQYTGMFGDLAIAFDEVREWFDFWSGLYGETPGERRTDILFPPSTGLSPERRKHLDERLHDMDVGSEAVFIGGQAIAALLRSFGVLPDVMLGHSSGESSALAAAGAIAPGFDALGGFIRELNAVYRRILAEGDIATGALLTVGALTFAEVEQHAAAVDPDIALAMDNCKNQIVLYGAPEAIARLQERLTRASGITQLLPFDRGYHTKAFAKVSEAFLGYYENVGLGRPSVPLYSCATTGLFPESESKIRTLAAAQWSTPVRFRETVERMHDDGVRTFVEVGPSGNLTAFVNDILAGREYRAVATNQRRRGGLDQFLQVLAELYTDARPVALARLFQRRRVASIDLDGPQVKPRRGVLLDNTMPKIRLDDARRTALRALRSPSPNEISRDTATVAEPARAVAAASPAQATSPIQVDSDAESPIEASGIHPDLAADYFGLMRSFLEQQQTVVTAMHSAVPTSNTVPASIDGGPAVSPYTEAHSGGFLDEILEWDASHVVARASLSVHRDNYLAHHVLSGPVSDTDPSLVGLSCVALMVSLEIMAQAAALLAGHAGLHVIENVRAYDWIALDEGELLLEVRAEVTEREGTFRALLLGPTGKAVSAEYVFVPSAPKCAPLAALAEWRPSVWNDEGLYTCGMFHGPLFQSIAHIDGWDDSGIDAQLSRLSLRGFFRHGELPELVMNPVLLDAMGQLAAYWIAQYAGTGFNCFPSTIERIELYATCPEDVDGAHLRARQRPLDPSTRDVGGPRSWDFECVDGTGQPLVRLSNLVNVFFPVPQRFYEVRRDPLGGWLGRPAHAPSPAPSADGTDSSNGRGDLLLWELPLLEEDFCAQSGNIFMRILAQVYLSWNERAEWQALGKTVRGKREWLLGRACMKEAVRAWIYERTGHLLYPSDILVEHDTAGAPFVDGSWRGLLVDAPEVSLSHDDHSCLAAVVEPVSRVGVDRERIGRLQRPELVIESLTAREREQLVGVDESLLQDRVLRLWCAKEAAAKFLGTGLKGEPSAFEVRVRDQNWATALVDHQDVPVHVELIREDTSIIALAREVRWNLQ